MDERCNQIIEVTTSIREIVYFISVHNWIYTLSMTGWVMVGSCIPVLLVRF